MKIHFATMQMLEMDFVMAHVTTLLLSLTLGIVAEMTLPMSFATLTHVNVIVFQKENNMRLETIVQVPIHTIEAFIYMKSPLMHVLKNTLEMVLVMEPVIYLNITSIMEIVVVALSVIVSVGCIFVNAIVFQKRNSIQS